MNDDLISRFDAIAELDHVYGRLENINMSGSELSGELEDIVLGLPSVQQKTGHWIEEAGDLRCSECEFLITDEYYLGKGVACPNCGAKMEMK